MPYQTTSELPQAVRDRYTPHQQRAFLAAFNSASANPDNDESAAFAIAHSAAERAKEKQLDFATNSGFKALSDTHWLAWYTNPYQDRDEEWISEKAIDEDLTHMIRSGDLPELWFYHLPFVKFGQATHVMKAGRFAVAFGQIDDTPIAKALFRHAIDQQYLLSHGFKYSPAEFIDNTYHAIRTFEISVLPSEVASNPYTTFLSINQEQEDKVMKMTDAQRAALKVALKDVGVDLDTLVQVGQQRSKELDGHATYKGVGDLIEELASAEVAADVAEGEGMTEAPEMELDMKGYMARMDKTMQEMSGMLKQLLGNKPSETAPMTEGKAVTAPALPVTPPPATAALPLPPTPAQYTPEQLMAAFEALKMGNATPPATPAPAMDALNQDQVLDEVAKRMHALEQAKQKRYGGSVRDMIQGVVQQYGNDTAKQMQTTPPGMFDPASFAAQAMGDVK
jgi:cation transport regulator